MHFNGKKHLNFLNSSKHILINISNKMKKRGRFNRLIKQNFIIYSLFLNEILIWEKFQQESNDFRVFTFNLISPMLYLDFYLDSSKKINNKQTQNHSSNGLNCTQPQRIWLEWNLNMMRMAPNLSILFSHFMPWSSYRWRIIFGQENKWQVSPVRFFLMWQSNWLKSFFFEFIYVESQHAEDLSSYEPCRLKTQQLNQNEPKNKIFRKIT